jgi:hypothetical protein
MLPDGRFVVRHGKTCAGVYLLPVGERVFKEEVFKEKSGGAYIPNRGQTPDQWVARPGSVASKKF